MFKWVRKVNAFAWISLKNFILSCRIALFTLAMMASMAAGNIFLSFAEVYKQKLIADGASESYAECIVSMYRTTGVPDDIFSLENYSKKNKLADKITPKMQFSEIVCSCGGYPFLYFLVAVFLPIVICCCCCCIPCCPEKKPVVIQMRPTTYSKMRQERICTVWKVASQLNVRINKKKSSKISFQRDFWEMWIKMNIQPTELLIVLRRWKLFWR